MHHQKIKKNHPLNLCCWGLSAFVSGHFSQMQNPKLGFMLWHVGWSQEALTEVRKAEWKGGRQGMSPFCSPSEFWSMNSPTDMAQDEERVFSNLSIQSRLCYGSLWWASIPRHFPQGRPQLWTVALYSQSHWGRGRGPNKEAWGEPDCQKYKIANALQDCWAMRTGQNGVKGKSRFLMWLPFSSISWARAEGGQIPISMPHGHNSIGYVCRCLGINNKLIN